MFNDMNTEERNEDCEFMKEQLHDRWMIGGVEIACQDSLSHDTIQECETSCGAGFVEGALICAITAANTSHADSGDLLTCLGG